MSKVFDEQALLIEIERVFGRWGSHAYVLNGMIEKLERLEKERNVLINCVLDLHSVYNDQRVKQAFEEIGYIEGDKCVRGTITLTSGGGACPEQYWGTTDSGECVYIRFRWGGALLDINNTVVYTKDYEDPYRGYFQDGELEAFVKEAGYKFIPLF